MPENVLYNLASSLLIKLGSPAMEEFSLLWNSKSELEKLRNTVSTITDVLLDAVRRQETDAAVQGWVTRFRDEIYRADDLFDELTVRALQKRVCNKTSKEVRRFFSKSNQLAFHIRITHEVKDLRQRLDNIAKDMNQYKFLVGRAEDQQDFNNQIREQSHSYVREDDIIGREKEKQAIVQMLQSPDSDQHVSVVTIVGIRGLGKTALAQLVYNDKQVEDYFAIRLWACVNYLTNLNDVLAKIVGSGSSDRHNALELDQLASMLMNKIRGKRFLLILDNVWDEVRENWLKLKALLDVGAEGSRVLVTTWLEIVATNLGADETKFMLKGLSDSDSLSLFVKMTFGTHHPKLDYDTKMLGRQIIKKCGNVPLAIRCVGSYLYKKDKSEWLSILNYKFTTVIPKKENHINQVLMICYNDFPRSLKNCFAFCSLFPKDHVFSKDALIHFWMAQGFLDHNPNDSKSLEDRGEKYILYLVQRCFFQNISRDSNREIIRFKMHDLLHDLAIHVAGSESFLIKSVDSEELNERTPRHVAYNCDVDFTNGFELQQNYYQLRTLLFYERRVFNKEVLDRLVQHLRSLRTLDLSYLQMETLPNSIGELLHLRYLDLSENQVIEVLPNSICKLLLLQTLNLSNCCQLMHLPSDLPNLTKLRHLLIKGCNKLTCFPPGLRRMTSLVKLDKFVTDKYMDGLRCLEPLDNLSGDLDIVLIGDDWKSSSFGVDDPMILKNKTKLKHLKFSWSDVSGAREEHDDSFDRVLNLLQPSNEIVDLHLSNFGGKRIASWISSLNNLVKLQIISCRRCLHFPPFSALPRLKRLVIEDIPLLEYIEDVKTETFFTSLEFLYIAEMPNLKGWWREVGESGKRLIMAQSTPTNQSGYSISSLPWFPCLLEIEIVNCPKVVGLPLFPWAKNVFFDSVTVEQLRQSAMINVEISSSSGQTSLCSSSSTVNQTWSCQLERLTIRGISDLVSFPEEWAVRSFGLRNLSLVDCQKLESLSPNLLQQLTTLETLIILYCPKFDWFIETQNVGTTWLPKLTFLVIDLKKSLHGVHVLQRLHQLTALKILSIRGYKPYNVDNNIDGDMWIAPPSLNELILFDMENVVDYNCLLRHLSEIEKLTISWDKFDGHELEALPWKALTNLRSLSLESNINMLSLPERCEDLPLLQHLRLQKCPLLESLPLWVNRLQLLEINLCPLLDKYKKPMGECWHEIRDIPTVSHNTIDQSWYDYGGQFRTE